MLNPGISDFLTCQVPLVCSSQHGPKVITKPWLDLLMGQAQLITGSSASRCPHPLIPSAPCCLLASSIIRGATDLITLPPPPGFSHPTSAPTSSAFDPTPRVPVCLPKVPRGETKVNPPGRAGEIVFPRVGLTSALTPKGRDWQERGEGRKQLRKGEWRGMAASSSCFDAGPCSSVAVHPER